jgi:hypothetical protein
MLLIRLLFYVCLKGNTFVYTIVVCRIMSGHILGPIFCAAHNCLRNYACKELGPVFLMCFLVM